MSILNEVDNELESFGLATNQGDDIALWKQEDGRFANKFSAKKT